MSEEGAPAHVGPLRRLQAAAPYVVVLIAGLYLFHRADHIEFEQASGRIGPGAWPKLVLVLLLASALWGGLSHLLKASANRVREPDEAELEAIVRPPEIHPYRVWIAIAGTFLYLAIMPAVGFFLATAFYTLGLMLLGGFRRPVALAVLSLAIPVFFLFVFMRVVYVALPLGSPPFERLSLAVIGLLGVH